MAKSDIVPLAKGLIAGETDPIYGQLELSLVDQKNIEVTVIRKPYSGHPDVTFAIPSTSLKNFIDVMAEALEKLDDVWFAQTAATALRQRNETKTQ